MCLSFLYLNDSMAESPLLHIISRLVLGIFQLDIGTSFPSRIELLCYESTIMIRSALLLFTFFIFIVVCAGVDALCKSFPSNYCKHEGKKGERAPWICFRNPYILAIRNPIRFSRKKKIDEDDESSDDEYDVPREKIPLLSSFAKVLKNSYEASTSPLRKWSWEDLTFSAPFNLLVPNIDGIDDNDDSLLSEVGNDEEFYYEEVSPKSDRSNNNHPRYRQLPNTTKITHFCFLVHGHRGLSRDLSYMQAVMRKQARLQQRKRYIQIQKQIQQQQQATRLEVDSIVSNEHFPKSSQSYNDVQYASRQQLEETGDHITDKRTTIHSDKDNDGECRSPTLSGFVESSGACPPRGQFEDKLNDNKFRDHASNDTFVTNARFRSDHFVLHDLIVHSVTCNEKRTDDGVKAGGERIVDEIISFVREHMKSDETMSERDKSKNLDNVDDNLGELTDITISIVGNSLGGLYARYAVAELFRRCTVPLDCLQKTNVAGCDKPDDENDLVMRLDGKYRLHLNVFCTTAAPHLGLSGHTFVPLPRSAELGVARALGETGHDLFRLNTLLHEMAIDPFFLRPLGLFRKRVAYANAYGTDFPVPVSTAAFLSEGSTYPHHFTENMDTDTNEQIGLNGSNKLLDLNGNIKGAANGINSSRFPSTQSDNANDNTKNLVIATLHTPIKESNKDAADHISVSALFDDDDLMDSNGDSLNKDSIEVSRKELARMSTSLDSLGWKKVFVDVRKEIPRICISKSLLLGRTSKSNLKLAGETATIASKDLSHEHVVATRKDEVLDTVKIDQAELSTIFDSAEPIFGGSKAKCLHQLKEQGVVSSRDVAAAVTTTPLLSTDSNEISFYWPMGHNMIVAFSRSRWSAYMNKAGRPVVDALSRELVDDIFSFKENKHNFRTTVRSPSGVAEEG